MSSEILPLCTEMEQIEFDSFKELKTEDYDGNYIYLIQTNKYFNTYIYKIGHIEKLHGKIVDYVQDVKVFGVWKVNDCVKTEEKILDLLKDKFRIVQGKEFIEGHLDHIYKEIEKIVENN